MSFNFVFDKFKSLYIALSIKKTNNFNKKLKCNIKENTKFLKKKKKCISRHGNINFQFSKSVFVSSNRFHEKPQCPRYFLLFFNTKSCRVDVVRKPSFIHVLFYLKAFTVVFIWVGWVLFNIPHCLLRKMNKICMRIVTEQR